MDTMIDYLQRMADNNKDLVVLQTKHLKMVIEALECVDRAATQMNKDGTIDLGLWNDLNTYQEMFFVGRTR